MHMVLSLQHAYGAWPAACIWFLGCCMRMVPGLLHAYGA